MAPKASSCRSQAWGEVSASRSAATVPGRARDEGSGPDADGGVHAGCHPGCGCSRHPASRRQACSPTAWGAQGAHPTATRPGGGLPGLRSCTRGAWGGRPRSSNAQGPGRRTHSGGVAQHPPGPSGGLCCTPRGAHGGESSMSDHLAGFSRLHFSRAWAMRAAPPTALGGRRPGPRPAAAWTRGVQAERSRP